MRYKYYVVLYIWAGVLPIGLGFVGVLCRRESRQVVVSLASREFSFCGHVARLDPAYVWGVWGVCSWRCDMLGGGWVCRCVCVGRES